MAESSVTMLIDGSPINLEVVDVSSDQVRVIMPSKLDILEILFQSYRWTDRIPNVYIIYTPKSIKLKPGMQCVMTRSEFACLTETSFALECPDLAHAKRTSNAELFKELKFLGISSPNDWIDAIAEKSIRYHYNRGYVLVWSFDDECYTLTRMNDLVSLIQPMELDECAAQDADLARYLSGRGILF